MISLNVIFQRLGFRRPHRCNDLVNYADVFQMLREAEWHERGLQSIPLDRIVGSAGRFRQFDLSFHPRRKAKNGRHASIAQAREQGRALPPILVYKVAGAYFVEDGNHRISVARECGDTAIRARVIEFDPSGLIFEPACSRLGFRIRGSGSDCGC